MQPTEPERRSGIGSRAMLEVRLFLIALQFFTRLPVPAWLGFEPHWLQHASRYFTAVGVLVGAITAAVYLVSALLLPHVVAVLLSTIAGIYLTGALHEDGLADTCDGLGGGATRERALDIMTDSRIGAYGAIGIVLMLALKCATLASLPPSAVPAALLIGHALSRMAATALIWKLEYVKAAGKAKALAQRMSTSEFLLGVATVLAVIAAVLFGAWLPWQAVAAGVLAAALATSWLGYKFVRRIGGYTGDCLGAAQQVSEVAFYLALLAALAYLSSVPSTFSSSAIVAPLSAAFSAAVH